MISSGFSSAQLSTIVDLKGPPRVRCSRGTLDGGDNADADGQLANELLRVMALDVLARAPLLKWSQAMATEQERQGKSLYGQENGRGHLRMTSR